MNTIIKTNLEFIVFLRGFKKNLFDSENSKLEEYIDKLQIWCRNIETIHNDASINCTLIDNGGSLYDCEDEFFLDENPIENSEENISILLVFNGLDIIIVKDLLEHQLFHLYFKYIEFRPAETIYY
jgi:hypothetical protein